MVQAVIRQFEPNDWAVQLARLIQNCVDAALEENGRCSVTPLVIAKARSVLVLAAGTGKVQILAGAQILRKY